MSKEIFRGRFRVARRTNFGNNITFFLPQVAEPMATSFMHPLKHLTMATLRARKPDLTNGGTNPIIN